MRFLDVITKLRSFDFDVVFRFYIQKKIPRFQFGDS